ncbi:MAG: LpqB family beta-propeller domain-containing protein [Actinomycetota bacterium]
MRKALAASLAAALLLAGTGCSSVPTSSKAIVVGSAPSAGAVEDVRDEQGRIAGAPVPPGAAPDVIVDGFLGAEQDTTPEGKQLAADYLTAPTVWDETGETAVYTSREVTLRPSKDPAVRDVDVTLELLARISADGEYRPDVSRVQQQFALTLQPNGWRISTLPRGRRINNTDLSQVFRRVVPYFYSTREYGTLIPEPLYLPNDSSTRVGSLVERLVAGPTPKLAGFLPPSLFPPGTTLLSAPEPENNIAVVTFHSGDFANVQPALKPKIVAQIVWTLTALDSRIDAVTIRVGDQPFTFDAAKSPARQLAQTQDDWKDYDPDGPYAHRTSYFNLNGTLGSYHPYSTVHTGRPLGPNAGKPAVSADGSTVAVAAEAAAGLQELRVGPVQAGALVTQPKSERMTEPSAGMKQDGLFVVTQEGEESPVLYRVPPGAPDAKKVPTSDLNGHLYAFEVAPDGVRAAVIIDRDGRRSLEIGLIDRRAIDQAALRVGGFRSVIDATNINPLSVAWLDSGKLAFIGQRGAEDPAVFTVRIDGTAPEESPGSQQVLEKTRPGSTIAPQLVAIEASPNGARRGDGSSASQIMLVIDDVSATGQSVYITRGLHWTKLPDRARNQ